MAARMAPRMRSSGTSPSDCLARHEGPQQVGAGDHAEQAPLFRDKDVPDAVLLHQVGDVVLRLASGPTVTTLSVITSRAMAPWLRA